MAKKDPHLLSSHMEYQCPWFSIHKEKLRYPNGTENDYFVFRRESYFTVTIAKQKDQFLVLHQWRPTLRQYLWEFCAGGIDVGEDPQTAAQRELAEETGFEAKIWQFLGEFHVAPGYSTEKGMVFLAEDLEALPQGRQENPLEMIKVHWQGEVELNQQIQKGIFKDGPSLAAWSLYNAIVKRK